MAGTIRVSEDLHELTSAHKRDDETMEECLRRLFRGPDPEVLARIVGEPTGDAAADREAIEEQRERGHRRRGRVRERFEPSWTPRSSST